MTMDSIPLARTFGLFFATAIAELLGCYLPLLWLTGRGPAWLALPAALSLMVFVWLLTLHTLAQPARQLCLHSMAIQPSEGVG